MPKYTCSMGHPLDMLAEEGSEVSIARSKWNRFGVNGAREHGYTGPTPYDQLHQEVGDFLAVLQHCIAENLIDPVQLNKAIIGKRQHVLNSFGTELKFSVLPAGIHGGADVVEEGIRE